MEFKEGQEIKCPAPFVKYETFLENADGWTHGIRFESDDGYRSYGVADGEGLAVFQVVKLVDMENPFVDRILSRKKTIGPDRVESKHGPLTMLGKRAFERLVTGGRWNYEID